jgi:putative intracellular protease/amidase
VTPPEERLNSLVSQDIRQRCVVVIVADGFEETETIILLSLLRQAGLCVKSVGLTSGSVSSAHGVQLVPDLTLADLDCLSNTTIISVVILPEGKQSLSRLEADPRVHRLLRQVIAQRGQIVTSCEGLRVLRAARVGIDEPKECIDGQRMPVLLREPRQPLETFVRDLIRRLKQPLQT